MTWGKVGGQAPQGRDAEAGQRKSRLSALLGLTNERGPTSLSVGSRKQGSGAYREVARVSIPPTAVSYPDSTGGPEYYPQKLTGVALGGSPHDVHPAVG